MACQNIDILILIAFLYTPNHQLGNIVKKYILSVATKTTAYLGISLIGIVGLMPAHTHIPPHIYPLHT